MNDKPKFSRSPKQGRPKDRKTGKRIFDGPKKPERGTKITQARKASVDIVRRQLKAYPDLFPLTPNTTGMFPMDAALTKAIYRETINRWLTIEWLLRQTLTKPLEDMEEELRAIMMVGITQLLFMDKIPPYAVVDQTVNQASQRIRPGAGHLANAILRKIDRSAKKMEKPWSVEANAIPWHGGMIEFRDGIELPSMDDLPARLEAATSHPRKLIASWFTQMEEKEVLDLLKHNLRDAPLTIFSPDPEVWDELRPRVHEEDARFLMFYDETHLAIDLLKQSPECWVQDYASQHVIDAMANVEKEPEVIIDACAGGGTKSRGMRELFPDAMIYAVEVDQKRLSRLDKLAEHDDKIKVVHAEDVKKIPDCDLLLIDVPCSNSGTFARRHEARYRMSEKSVQEMVNVQQNVIGQYLDKLKADGDLFYSTCSIDQKENQDQIANLVQSGKYELIEEMLVQPRSQTLAWQEGGYYAHLRLKNA